MPISFYPPRASRIGQYSTIDVAHRHLNSPAYRALASHFAFGPAFALKVCAAEWAVRIEEAKQ
jgi:hypothetical protein